MGSVKIEHNLSDAELTEVLEKALVSVRTKIERPARKFRQPAMETVAKRVTSQFDAQFSKMMKRIEKVIRG